MPLMNPDGYEYSHDHDRMWRKNRVPPPSGEHFLKKFEKEREKERKREREKERKREREKERKREREKERNPYNFNPFFKSILPI
jgi:hypothetical protein